MTPDQDAQQADKYNEVMGRMDQALRAVSSEHNLNALEVVGVLHLYTSYWVDTMQAVAQDEDEDEEGVDVG